MLAEPHPIVTLTLILLYLRILIFRFLLRGGVAFAMIICFIPDNIGVLNFELSLFEIAFLSECTKCNSCKDSASDLVDLSFSLLSNPRFSIARK